MSKVATKGINGLKRKHDKQFIQEIMFNRSAVVRQETVYVVDMIENGKLVESRQLPGHSEAYAESCAENWKIGVIK